VERISGESEPEEFPILTPRLAVHCRVQASHGMLKCCGTDRFARVGKHFCTEAYTRTWPISERSYRLARHAKLARNWDMHYPFALRDDLPRLLVEHHHLGQERPRVAPVRETAAACYRREILVHIALKVRL
jgi:hypothetical protein